MSNRRKRTVFNIHFLGGNDDNNLYISRIVLVEMLKNVLNLYFALKLHSNRTLTELKSDSKNNALNESLTDFNLHSYAL